MIKRTKGVEVVVFIFITHLNAFGSNVLLGLTIMNFEDVLLIKVIHFYMKKNMDA
jgi:hypothetical protein